MAATFNLELREQKQNARGEGPIYLRITYNRKNAWMSTGLRVKPKYWDEGTQRVRRSHDRYKTLNEELFNIESKAQDAIIRLRSLNMLDAKRAINRVKGYNTENFFTYAKAFIENQKAQKKLKSAQNMTSIINKTKDFVGSESLALNEIDLEFLNGLQAHLINKFENSSNTIRKNFKHLRQILEEARKQKYIVRNPFDDFDMPSYQKPKKTALSIKQIEKLQKLKLDKDSDLWHTRNFFMFSFYNAGIRFGDLCLLKRENIRDGRLKYIMSKTASNVEPKWKNIKLLPQAIEILEAYNYLDKAPKEFLFPILEPGKNYEDPLVFDREKHRRNSEINSNLDDIAKQAGIEENLTTHLARHSFANYARKKGMSVYSISKALAHSDLKTTEHYLASFDEEMLDSEMEDLFN